jgi:hypothetical protein
MLTYLCREKVGHFTNNMKLPPPHIPQVVHELIN